MAKIPGSIPVAGPIAPTDVSDTHGTHYSNFGVGGVHHAATLAERDAIPAERREEGMLCTVADANGGGVPCTFQLVGGKSNACWQAFATGSGGGGAPGAPGKDGKDGVDGKDGADGKSAYELAVQHGFQGSEEDYLTSISKIQLAEPALDWANAADVTATVTTEGNYTVRQFTAGADGLVIFTCVGVNRNITQAASATGLVISVNGYTTQAGNIHRLSSTMTLSQRVNKGDVVRCSFITADATFNALKLVPVKGVSGEMARAVAHAAAPSNKAANLTLPAAGGSIIAPDDGFVALGKWSTAASQYATLNNKTAKIMDTKYAVAAGQSMRVHVHCSKGDEIGVGYTVAGDTEYFRFIYANGAAPE